MQAGSLGPLASGADNGRLTEAICLDRSLGDGSRGSTVVIFVMGGDDDLAHVAPDRFEACTERWGRPCTKPT
jgi:hypothetical protein